MENQSLRAEARTGMGRQACRGALAARRELLWMDAYEQLHTRNRPDTIC